MIPNAHNRQENTQELLLLSKSAVNQQRRTKMTRNKEITVTNHFPASEI